MPKHRLFNQTNPQKIKCRAADEYSGYDQKGADDEQRGGEYIGRIHVKQIAPHKGSPCIAVGMNHKNAKGGFGNQIDTVGVINLEIFEGGEQENANQYCTKFMRVLNKIIIAGINWDREPDSDQNTQDGNEVA